MICQRYGEARLVISQRLFSFILIGDNENTRHIVNPILVQIGKSILRIKETHMQKGMPSYLVSVKRATDHRMPHLVLRVS